MAVRFSADGQDYTRTISLGAQTQFSFSLWLKISVDRDAFSTPLSLDASSSDNCTLQTGSDGLQLDLRSGGVMASRVLTVGTWTFVGVSVNGANGTMVTRSVNDGSFTTATWTTGKASTTLANLRLGESSWGNEWLNGCLASVKIWTGATLTATELQAEYPYKDPLRTANLRAFYAFDFASTTDNSGNGWTLSGGVGTTSESGPSLAALPGNFSGWGIPVF
ncbi:LamG-like jellyroll fold domain-containing protein [Nonomuraea sp. B19D2]|uniref:LamG-like jellyroll fold domain-containing protein n=1 Tax=Nonomuraea sp. B19D2 TaxID=3159561 RepID=UPI0032DB4B10